LHILSWTSLVVVQRVFPCVLLFMNTELSSCPDPEKTAARHETILLVLTATNKSYLFLSLTSAVALASVNSTLR
jgi:hypothetical protein